VTFAYDALGRRVSRSAGGTTTTFVRAGDENGGQVLLEKQGTTVTASYTYGNALIAKGSETYLFDGLGSSRQTTDATGAVTASRTFEGFGQLVAGSGAAYGFAAQSGYRDDGDAGLVHIGARYYDPQVGRFISRDTYLDQKPYLYCEHDPVNFLDPSGHAKAYEWLGAIGGAIAGIGTPLALVPGCQVPGAIIAATGAFIAGLGGLNWIGQQWADSIQFEEYGKATAVELRSLRLELNLGDPRR
jgi:RHS repeat-associated protein